MQLMAETGFVVADIMMVLVEMCIRDRLYATSSVIRLLWIPAYLTAL